MDESRRVWHANLEEKIIQFLFVEFILTYIRNPQYRSEISPPNIYWRESQGHTQLSVVDMTCVAADSAFWREKLFLFPARTFVNCCFVVFLVSAFIACLRQRIS